MKGVKVLSYKRRTLSPDSPYAAAAALLIILSVGLRFASFAINFSSLSLLKFAVDYLLPVAFCIIMTVVLLSRRNNLMPTILPLILYFASAALGTVDLEPRMCAVCAGVYAILPAVYALTVAGVLGSRTLLFLSCAGVITFDLIIKTSIMNPPADFAAFLPSLAAALVTLSVMIEARGMRRGRLY